MQNLFLDEIFLKDRYPDAKPTWLHKYIFFSILRHEKEDTTSCLKAELLLLSS